MRCGGLLTLLLMAYAFGGALAAGSDAREGVLRSAAYRWTFETHNPALNVTGDVTFGVPVTGNNASTGARTAVLSGGYLRAANAGNVTGSEITVLLRARDPRGIWSYALLSKRGSTSITNFNLFSTDLPGTPGNDIGFQVHTERGIGTVSFPITRIDATAWHNFAGRYDGRTLEILCDGRVMDRKQFGGALTQNDEPVLIGAETDSGHVVRPFAGEIEEAAIWSRALSDRDIARVMRTDAIKPDAGFRPTVVSPIRYRPDIGAVADTIPFYWKGEYHVFYLLANLGGTPWAHIVSRDLVHWRELPIALPLGKRSDPDGENVFTGSVIHGGGAFHIFYTGFNPSHPGGREQIMHATSPDLVTWTKHPEHTFRADGIRYRSLRGEDFRDPFVYQVSETGRYRMLLCTRDGVTGAPVTGVAESDNLVTWQLREPLARNWPDTPECPDLFSIGVRWYLLASPPAHGVTEVRTAPSENGPWAQPEGPAIDTPILYAAKSMFDGRRHVLVGWLRDLEGNQDSGAHLWGGDQCVPRELYADESGRLCARPVPEAAAQFRKRIYSIRAGAAPQEIVGKWKRTSAGWQSVPADGAARVRFAAPDSYMLRCRVQLETGAALGVRFRVPAAGEGGYRLLVEPGRDRISLSSQAFRYERPCPQADKKSTVEVQAFVQGTLIECFVDGAYAFSCRAYDYRSGALELETVGGSGTIGDLAISVCE